MSLETKVKEIMDKNPTGLLVFPSKTSINCIFWQDKPPEEKILWHNFLGGICNFAIQKNQTTKDELMKYLQGLL